MAEELTPGALREAARDLARTFFVEASAGTGKTRLLCDRALAALLTPGYDPAQLVAITFTEKAAAELAARLRADLEAWVAAHPGDAQAARARERFDLAQISTIHAFAASLLRERPVEAAVDPAFEVFDATETTFLFERIWEEWLRTEADRPAGAAAWASLWRHFGAPQVPFLREAVATMVAERDLVRTSGYDLPAIDTAPLREAVGAARGRFAEVRGACVNAADACYLAGEALEGLAAAIERGDLDAVCAAAVKPGGNKKNWRPPELKDELNERYVKPVAEELARVCEARRRGLLPPVAAWLAGAAEAFARRKEEASGLDFQDLLLRAARLLRDKENGARAYFQRRYRHILVDEFQDTDPLQVELVFYLAEKGAAATDWRDVALVPGKLFLVGDPKQSIYRFRRADVEIYNAARRVMERHGGDALRLIDNFRSAPRLITFVNASFEAVFGEGEPPYQPAYGELRPSAETRARGEGTPAVRVVEGREGPFEEERGAAEAVAALIRRAVEEGEFDVYDRGAGGARPIAYRDVAVLMRVHARAEAWEAALERWGVPFYTHGGRTFYVRPEVKALSAAARALDNPADAPALLAALTSSLFSFHADDLLRFRLAGGHFDYRRDVPAEAPPRLAEAFELLGDLHARRLARPPAATLAELVARTRLLTKAALWGDGPRAVANIRKVLASARLYVDTGGIGLRGFARWLGERAGREEAEHESPALDAGDDFVRLMTIHAAKGLEFPAVVFADWARPPRRAGGEEAFVDRRTGLLHLAVGSVSAGTKLLTPGYEAAAAEEGRFGAAEESRLAYVAATRARDLLLLPRYETPGEGSLAAALEALGPEAGGAETIVIDTEKERERVRAPGGEPAAAPDLGAAHRTWKDRLSAALARARRPAAFVAASRLAHVAADTREEPEPGAAPRAEAARLGSALHAVMAEVNLGAKEVPPALLAEKCRAEGLSEAARATVGRWARNCLAAAPVREAAAAPAREAAAAPAAFREMPFAVAVGGVTVSGIVDLAYEAGDGLVIVDYKTDEAGAGRAEGVYRDQLAVYAAAMTRVTGRPPARVYLVFAREAGGRGVVDLGAGEALAARGEALLREASERGGAAEEAP